MGKLILPGDNTTWNGFSLLGESSLAITFDETGIGDFNELPFLVLSGTTAVSIGSTGNAGGRNEFIQLAENNNVLTTVTIGGSERFFLGSDTGHSNKRRRCCDRHHRNSRVAETLFADAHRRVGDHRRGGN